MPDVIVIGGGSTGTGVARDLSMRGLDVTLVEKGKLTHGTTGRMHGLLHSGARYAVADPTSAEHCIAENQVIREIASHCVEDTGGLFVKRPEDPEAYFDRKLEACRACGIPATVIDGTTARSQEPALAGAIEKAIRVPDAAVDPFRLTVANAAAAEQRGARIATHAEVTDLLVEDDAIIGVEVRHDEPAPSKKTGQVEEIYGEHVVNATGAWAGKLGELAGVEIGVRPAKGAMVVMNVRQVDTVINRCRPKGDADIIVPHETTAILGTTDIEVADPEEYAEEQWEVDRLIDELSALVPILQDARSIRSFWGVRPLYEPSRDRSDDSAAVTRDFFVLDHAQRDDIAGFTSIVGGKFTTYRLMAERVADHVCSRLGVSRDCRTGEVPLPGSEDHGMLDEYMEAFGLRSPIAKRSAERLGSRTPEVLETTEPNPVVCACEAVTRAEIQDAIGDCGPDLNGVRIRTRASMGNCQGGFCAHGLASELYPEYPLADVQAAFGELIAERWKGQRHALWGDQLAQAMLNYALMATTMNDDRSPPEHDIAWTEFDGGTQDGD